MNESAQFIYNNEFCARTKDLREGRGWTAAQMATALGVPVERYRKYETRSPMPHFLLERFSIIVGCDLPYLLTGKSAPMRAVPDSKNKKKTA
jgi:transcriptional regulator with XRE-family HTH domain